eukprot:TRINITY_DN15702_c0_g1_i2.p1 TRINITY_DN15702_c0_g1~~TRINITY_DN15702_c0_g1_i2.p1  ORF type:complete len:345 (+),score=34.84 TRINITY_DN15702_c0_g1_i2:318-1352(+)
MKAGFHVISSIGAAAKPNPKFKASSAIKPIAVLKPNINANNQQYYGRNEKVISSHKGNPYERRPNGYDLYSYGKIPLSSRNNPYELVRVAYQPSDQLSQSFYQQPKYFNQSVCSCRKEHDLESKSFCQSLDRSFDLSGSFEFGCDATPIKHSKAHSKESIVNCAVKCKDLRSDLQRLKEYTRSEERGFKAKLEQLKALIVEKRKACLALSEEAMQTNMENELSLFTRNDSIGKLDELCGDCESPMEATMKPKNSKHLGAEKYVELPEIEFKSASKRVNAKHSNKKPAEPLKFDNEEVNKASPLKGDKKMDKDRSSSRRKSVCLMCMAFIILILAAMFCLNRKMQ